MTPALVISSHVLLSLIILYLVVSNKARYLIYSAVLLLLLCSVVGSLFRIMHMPGGDELLIVGLAGTVVGSVLLIWKSFRNRQDQLMLYKLLAGLILLAQIGIVYLAPHHAEKAALLHYPLAAFIGTLLINKQYEHEGERSILILFIVQSLMYIVMEISEIV